MAGIIIIYGQVAAATFFENRLKIGAFSSDFHLKLVDFIILAATLAKWLAFFMWFLRFTLKIIHFMILAATLAKWLAF